MLRNIVQPRLSPGNVRMRRSLHTSSKSTIGPWKIYYWPLLGVVVFKEKTNIKICSCSVQRKTNIKIWLHQSAQPNILGLFASLKKQVTYTFFHNKASKVGMLHWTWWLLKLATACCTKSCNQTYRPHAIFACTLSWNNTIIMMHTWTYRRNEKAHF